MIGAFKGDYRFLSNFFPHPVLFENVVYPSNEHAFQAAKYDGLESRLIVRDAGDARKAKRLGRAAKLSSDWNDRRNVVMETIVRNKFENGVLRQELEMTGDHELVEGNYWHDNYWGDCDCDDCENITGQNRLGLLLMRVRAENRSR